MIDDALTALSRCGWDRIGDPRTTPWEFRHSGTGDEVSCLPGDVLYWAAQLAARVIPAGKGDWYAERLWLDCGLVRSRSGRKVTGVTHNRRGERLFFFHNVAGAEAAAALLNLRDVQPRQARMEL